MISQRLMEAAEGTRMTRFKDIVPKPYQEFKDVFAKESFNELLDQKKWDHAIEIVPDAQTFSTKVYLLEPVEQKQLDDFLEFSRANTYAHPSHPWPSPSSSLRKGMGASTSSKITGSSIQEHLPSSPDPQ